MGNQTIHDIHKDYVRSGVSFIRDANGLKNKELLQELLTELSQEYVKTVFGTVEKVKISAEEAAERDLISSEQLKQKFFQDIAKETNIDVKVKNARQLVESLFSENLEVSKARDEDILKPRILGTVENIGTIILPPDILEIVIGSGRGREQRETPVGFDKIGMVEDRLSSKLSRERTTFYWKTGTLNDNQMRKTSYYHLYVPEFNKTLLLNNQYGEGAFVVNGNFNIGEAKKSGLKGSSEAVMIKFDYEHPEEFLEKLDIELNRLTNKNYDKIPAISNNNVEIKNNLNIPKLGSDGRVEIEGVVYQRVGQATPPHQLREMKGQTAFSKVQKKIKEDSSWGKENVKQAKSKVGVVQVVKLGELEKLIKPSAELKEIGEDGKIEIEGEMYQWIGYATPPSQLGGMSGSTVSTSVQSKIKKEAKWGEKNIRKAKGGNRKEIQVVRLSELEKIIKELAELKKVGEDGRVEIDGEIYQRVGSATPPSQLRGMTGWPVNKRVQSKIKKEAKWGEENIRQARYKDQKVQVVKLSELAKLIRTSAELKRVGEDGRVEIDEEIYQWVGYKTPLSQLREIKGQTAFSKVQKKIKEDSSWGKENVRQARYKDQEVQVVQLSELKKLLGKS